MADSHWEYQLFVNGSWRTATPSGRTEPHHYETEEEVMRVLKIIHSGEKVRVLQVKEVEVP